MSLVLLYRYLKNMTNFLIIHGWNIYFYLELRRRKQNTRITIWLSIERTLQPRLLRYAIENKVIQNTEKPLFILWYYTQHFHHGLRVCLIYCDWHCFFYVMSLCGSVLQRLGTTKCLIFIVINPYAPCGTQGRLWLAEIDLESGLDFLIETHI